METVMVYLKQKRGFRVSAQEDNVLAFIELLMYRQIHVSMQLHTYTQMHTVTFCS